MTARPITTIESELGRPAPEELTDARHTSEPDLVEERDERTTQEKEEDWLYFHLEVARRAHMRMHGAKDAADYNAERMSRIRAIGSALKHWDLLQRMGARMPPLLETMMKAEGL